jgi:hypothetical protein
MEANEDDEEAYDSGLVTTGSPNNEALCDSEVDAIGGPDSDALFESTTKKRIEAATKTARTNKNLKYEDLVAARFQQARIEYLEREEGTAARIRNQLRRKNVGTAATHEQQHVEQSRIDEVLATAHQMQEAGAIEEWRQAREELLEEAAEGNYGAASEEARMLIVQRVQGLNKTSQPMDLVDLKSTRVEHLRRNLQKKMSERYRERSEDVREYELAWSEARNVQWPRKRKTTGWRRDVVPAHARDIFVSHKGWTSGESVDVDQAAVEAFRQSEGFPSPEHQQIPPEKHKSSTQRCLQVQLKSRALLDPTWIDPDPDNFLASGQRIRLIPASPPQPQNWRMPRSRSSLNTNKDRIYTDYILADGFVNDINAMLDHIHNWPREDAEEIMKSFEHDIDNEKRRIKFEEFRGETRDWNVHIEDPHASMYHPRVYAHSHRLSPGRRPKRVDWGIIDNGGLPPDCKENGCGAGCPRQRTHADKQRILSRGRLFQHNEKILDGMMRGFRNRPFDILLQNRGNEKNRQAMLPPAGSRLQSKPATQSTESSSKILPLSAENLSKLSENTPICPSAPRLGWKELRLSEEQRKELETINFPQLPLVLSGPPASPRPQAMALKLNFNQRRGLGVIKSPQPSLSPTIAPEQIPIPPSKYIRVAHITKSKKDYYAKCLPPSASQAKHLIGQREVVPPDTETQNALIHYRNQTSPMLQDTQQINSDLRQTDPHRH